MQLETALSKIIKVKASRIRQDYQALKMPSPGEEKRLLASLERYGQISPAVVGEDGTGYILIDGFKRLRCLEKLAGETEAEVLVQVLDGGPQGWKAAILNLNWGKRSVTTLEEGLVLVSLYEEEELKQSHIAALLARDKSWVSRRIALIKRLEPDVQDHIRLGLIHPSVGRELALLPRGNQIPVLEAIEEHQLSMREVEGLVKDLAGGAQVRKADVETLINLARKEIPHREDKPYVGRKNRRDRIEEALLHMNRYCRKVCKAIVKQPREKVGRNFDKLAKDALEAAEEAVEALHNYYLGDNNDGVD